MIVALGAKVIAYDPMRPNLDLPGASFSYAEIDEIVAYIAPALLGSGAPMIGDLGVTSMAGIRRYALADVTRLGDDVRLTLRPLPDASRTSQINPSKE